MNEQIAMDCGPTAPSELRLGAHPDPFEVARAIEQAYARGVHHGMLLENSDEGAKAVEGYRCRLAQMKNHWTRTVRDRLLWRLQKGEDLT